MDEAQSSSRLPRSQYQEVHFDGDELIAVVFPGEGVAVPVRAVCAALTLDTDRQSAFLRDHEVLAQGLRLVRVPMGDRIRTVVAILHRFIPYWLATITPNQVDETVRPKLIRYQLELVDVLYGLYGGQLPASVPAAPADSALATLQQQFADALLQLRLSREALIQMQQQLGAIEEQRTQIAVHETRLTAVEGAMDELQQHLAHHTTISGPQQEIIKRAIQRLATRYKKRSGQDIYARLFTQFCIDLGTPKYSMLAAGKYEDALRWLREKAAEYLPDDPDALPPLQEALL